jgi:hypothetical protein
MTDHEEHRICQVNSVSTYIPSHISSTQLCTYESFQTSPYPTLRYNGWPPSTPRSWDSSTRFMHAAALKPPSYFTCNTDCISLDVSTSSITGSASALCCFHGHHCHYSILYSCLTTGTLIHIYAARRFAWNRFKPYTSLADSSEAHLPVAWKPTLPSIQPADTLVRDALSCSADHVGRLLPFHN